MLMRPFPKLLFFIRFITTSSSNLCVPNNSRSLLSASLQESEFGQSYFFSDVLKRDLHRHSYLDGMGVTIYNVRCIVGVQARVGAPRPSRLENLCQALAMVLRKLSYPNSLI